MAQPTFTSITPDKGHSGGGQIAVILGTNFRSKDPPYTVPEESIHDTVAVTIGGQPVEKVWVRSDTELNVRVPTAVFNPTADIKNAVRVDPDISRITFSALDVVITNLDDDGEPIVGESVTAPAAYSYEQPLIRAPEGDPPLLQVLVQFLRLLRRIIVHRASLSTHTDYGEEGVTYTTLSEHPSVGVRMDVLDDDEYSHYDNVPQLLPDGNDYVEYDMQKTVYLLFTLTLSSQNTEEVLHMVSNLIDLQMSTPWLIVPPDPDYPIAIPDNKYPLECVQQPKQIGTPNNANISAFSAQLRVRGIPILRGDPSTTFIKRRMTLTLATTGIEGNNPAVVTSPPP